MKIATFATLAGCLLLSACSKVIDTPSADQLRRDLVGHEFYYAFDYKSATGQKWAVKEGEVKEFVARKARSRNNGKTCEIPAYVTLSDGKKTIRGVLLFLYNKEGKEAWKLSLVLPKDCRPGRSFSFDVLVIDNR